MIEFINFKQYNKYNSSYSWKSPLKIGLIFILIGYIIFLLKELIIGFISFIFILLGFYFIYIAYTNWKNQIKL